jgi:hypothetical protein
VSLLLTSVQVPVPVGQTIIPEGQRVQEVGLHGQQS